MYTLLGATVLGFDLVRTPGGGPVASLVAEAIGLGPADLEPLARAHPLVLPASPERRHAEQGLGGSPLLDALGRMSRLVAAGEVVEALRVVEAAPMAGLEDLLRCVRREVFDWTWTSGPEGPEQESVAARAVDVVCDAVLAVHRAGELRDVAGGTSLAVVEQMVEPWATAHRLFPQRTTDLGPCHAELTALLEALAALDADGWQRLLAVGTRLRPQSSWAPAMHSATWSVHLSGRVREGAIAQLRAVRVLTDADVPPGVAARGVWNLVSGAVQSTVALDLVDDATVERLRTPVVAALGPA